MNYIFSFYFFLLSSQWGLVSSTLSTLSTFPQRDGVKKKEPVPEFVLHTAVFYRFVSAARWREEAAVFIPLDLSTPPHVVSNIRAPRGTHMFWWNTPVNCRRMRSKGGETHDLHVMVAIAEIAGLKSPARAAAMASFSAHACFDAGRGPRNPRHSGPPRHPPSNAAYNFCGRAPTGIVRT